MVFNAAGVSTGVGTSSPYYSTDAKLGVRARLPRAKASWITCRKAYRRGLKGVTLFLGASRPTAKRVSSVWMLRRGFDGCTR